MFLTEKFSWRYVKLFEIYTKIISSELKDNSLQGRGVILISGIQLCQAKKPLHTELNCIWELENHRFHCHIAKGSNPISDMTQPVRTVHYISEVQVMFAYLFCYQQQVSLTCPQGFICCHTGLNQTESNQSNCDQT